MWDKIKSAIKVIAPAVASVLGGPLAGNAVGALSNILLGKDDGSPEELEAAFLKATPEQLLKIKAIDLQFAELQNEEMSNARSMYLKTIETMGKPDWVTRYLAIWATLLFTAVIFGSNIVNDAFEKSILTFLFNLITNIFAFYCGRNTK